MRNIISINSSAERNNRICVSTTKEHMNTPSHSMIFNDFGVVSFRVLFQMFVLFFYQYNPLILRTEYNNTIT